MAKIKVKIRASKVIGKPATVFYRISHKSVVKQITTNLQIYPENWDETNQCIKISDNKDHYLQDRIDADISALHKILDELKNHNKPFTVEDIIDQFNNPKRYVSVMTFIREQIDFLNECKKYGTARNYDIAANSLTLYLKNNHLYFSEFNSRFIENYNDFLRKKGLVRNSISFHMRILRAIFNKAVRMGITEQTFPFRNAYTGIDKTRKRAVDEDVIAKLINLDLKNQKSLAFARDIFLFSFYTRGMTFVDIAFLRKTDISQNSITYKRQKTGQHLRVRIEPCIRAIMERYAPDVGDSPYIFPILDSLDIKKCFLKYRSSLRVYNGRLKRLSELLGLNESISSYTSRHSWATTARNLNVPISIISAGMGHISENTTQIYLNSIENTKIDNANREILERLNQTFS